MESTQTDVALDALRAALAAGLSDVELVDGQPIKLDEPDCLIVGWSPTRPAVEIQQEQSGLDKNRRSERLTVACVLSVWRGDTDPKAVRDAAKARMDEIRDVLAANRTLGGEVTRAVLGYDGTLDQAQTNDGATATFDFTILVTTL